MFLRDNVVRFIGDPVLAVAADDQQILDKALALVKVEYEPLSALHDPFKAMEETDVKIHSRGNVAFKVNKVYGDIHQGFKKADIVIENRYRTSKQKHAAPEPFGTCVAHCQSNGKLTVYSSTQLPHWSRHYLAGALDLPLNKVRVIKGIWQSPDELRPGISDGYHGRKTGNGSVGTQTQKLPKVG